MRSIFNVAGGGGEDPRKPQNVYTSKDQIKKDTEWVRSLLKRKNAPQYLAANTVTARNVGDPVPQFVYANGKPSLLNRPVLQTALPSGVSINDVFQTNEGTYGFMHPQQGTFVQVDPTAIYSKYGKK